MDQEAQEDRGKCTLFRLCFVRLGLTRLYVFTSVPSIREFASSFGVNLALFPPIDFTLFVKLLYPQVMAVYGGGKDLFCIVLTHDAAIKDLLQLARGGMARC